MPELSTWETWDPRQYLTDYYSEVQPDEVETIRFLVDTLIGIRPDQLVLEFGCGPTLHHVFPVVPYAEEIHMADYLTSNLDEISKWLLEKGDRHNWYEFIKYTLKCEGTQEPAHEEVMFRKRETRRKISALLQSDASQVDPLGIERRAKYPLVLSCYCADSATDDKRTWINYMRNIASLVAPGGMFITTALLEASHYQIGNKRFPSSSVGVIDMEQVLRLDFLPESITIEVKQVPEHEYQGYKGIILAHAIKP